jgi:hypothetical protein
MKKGEKNKRVRLGTPATQSARGHHSPRPTKQTNTTTDNQPMVTTTYQHWGKVSPIKTVKKKWMERCGNAKTIGQMMAMGVDSRGLWEVFWKFWDVLRRSTQRGIGVLNRMKPLLRLLSPKPPLFLDCATRVKSRRRPWFRRSQFVLTCNYVLFVVTIFIQNQWIS